MALIVIVTPRGGIKDAIMKRQQGKNKVQRWKFQAEEATDVEETPG